jgi:translation initiation factor IF-1
MHDLRKMRKYLRILPKLVIELQPSPQAEMRGDVELSMNLTEPQEQPP